MFYEYLSGFFTYLLRKACLYAYLNSGKLFEVRTMILPASDDRGIVDD